MSFITSQEFFGGIHFDSYVFALGEKGQLNGSKPMDHCKTDEDYNNFFIEKYVKLNKEGFGIHFTPNGVKSVEDRNKLKNLLCINTWFVDVDVDETKQIINNDDLVKRKIKKDEILTKIFDSDIWPSLIVETRNGYHLYWWSIGDAKEKNYKLIQTGLAKKFNGDIGAAGVLHSLRVPGFKYKKNGEEGYIEIWEGFSTKKLYTEMQMFEFVGQKPDEVTLVVTNHKEPELTPISYKISIIAQKDNVFEVVEKMPVRDVIEWLSGRTEVNGDVFTFVNGSNGKFNLLANGKSTPNFISPVENKIFSNNTPAFCLIKHFLEWYGHDGKSIYKIFKSIINGE